MFNRLLNAAIAAWRSRTIIVPALANVFDAAHLIVSVKRASTGLHQITTALAGPHPLGQTILASGILVLDLTLIAKMLGELWARLKRKQPPATKAVDKD